MEKKPILTTRNLAKRYGNIQALKDLSLTIEQGDVYGILGPNGSGKTTTLGIILDIVAQDSGTYEWFGEHHAHGNKIPLHESRKKIGSILETPNFYPYLSAERNLKIAADIKGVSYSDIDRVLQVVDLYDRKKDKFKGYSLGMKQRLAIASALLGNPQVLLLDEPTNGLDPEGIAQVREIIQTVAKENITVILASHVLDEVEKVCSHVAILKKGQLLAQGSVGSILSGHPTMELKADEMFLLEKALYEHPSVVDIKKENELLVVKFDEEVSTAIINKYLFDKGITPTHIASKKQNLEKEFLSIINSHA